MPIAGLVRLAIDLPMGTERRSTATVTDAVHLQNHVPMSPLSSQTAITFAIR